MSQVSGLNIIAHIYNDFSEKFGIPRQSGIVNSVKSKIVFEPEYQNPDAIRGLEEYSHIWLLWQFSESHRQSWSPTVRPPKLGGNTRVGVFASRSPFRPNPIGLSSVQLSSIQTDTADGPVLYVCGGDLMNGTPIYDIKPYLPYTDSHPDALQGFAVPPQKNSVEVSIPVELSEKLPLSIRNNLIDILKEDPRPGYQHSSERVYGLTFGNFNISFSVDGQCLSVLSVDKIK